MANEPADIGAMHLPAFITPPGETDVLFVAVFIFLVVIVFVIGALYFRLHALPEHMAHRSSRAQYQVVAILALIALFTHNNLFWIAALLLAAVQLPDLLTPFRSIARSLEAMSGVTGDADDRLDPGPAEEPRGQG